MSGTSRTTALPRHGGGPADPSGPRKLRSVARWLGVVAAVAVVALLSAALIPGSHASGGDGLAQRSVAAQTTPHHSPVLETKVVDSSISARRYGTLIAQMENGVNQDGQFISDLSPIPAARFGPSIAAYRRYAERWAVTLASRSASLTAALRAGDRALGRLDWQRAFAAYLRLGASYNLLPEALNDRLDELPPVLGEHDFPGLHRIEMGLWTGQAPRSLVPVAVALQGAVGDLRRSLPRIGFDVLDYTLRSHEVLEDAQRDYLSGTGVPWSHAGVLGVAAGVAATRELVATMTPLLEGRDNVLGEAQYWLGRLQSTVDTLRRPGGLYATLPQLSEAQQQRLAGVLTGTLNALQELPGALETEPIPTIPSIPSHP